MVDKMQRPKLYTRMREMFALTPLEHYYAGIVLDHCNAAGYSAIKHKNLAKKFGVSVRQAGTIMRSLEAKGVLQAFKRFAKRNGVMRQISNVYRVMINFGDAAVEKARKQAAIAKEVWEKRQAAMLRRGTIVVRPWSYPAEMPRQVEPAAPSFDVFENYRREFGRMHVNDPRARR